MTFPATQLDVHVELLLGGTWTDITSFVYTRQPVTIDRGRPDEGSRTDPGRLEFTVNNRDGRFSPRNPRGAWFGLLGRNTPIRVSVVHDAATYYRFAGEVSSWPVRWDISQNDVFVPIEAAGILRRLGSGAELRSALYRELTDPSLVNPPVAYWPCEDGEHADAIASGFDSGRPMTISGDARLASNTDFAASDAIVEVRDAVLKGRVPAYRETLETEVAFLLSIPETPPDHDTLIVSIDTTGSIQRWELRFSTAVSSGGTRLRGFDENNTVVADSSNDPTKLDGSPARMALQFIRRPEASFDEFIIAVLRPGMVEATINGSIVSGHTFGRIVRVLVNGDRGLGGTAVGHISVHNDIEETYEILLDSLDGHSGETAGQRVARLCDEEGVALETVGDVGDPPQVGPQLPARLLDLLEESAVTDSGVLFESRDRLGLGFRTHRSVYNQTADATLDYAASQVAPPLEPIDDDQRTVNDVTASSRGGSSSRQAATAGPLSVQAPPEGVGRYSDQVTVSAHHNEYLPHLAGWLVRLGTVDEERYPTIHVDFAAPGVSGDAALVDALYNLDAGDRLVVANPPDWLPPESISQIVQGYRETLGPYEHRLELNCAPESPWRVATYDESGATAARYGTRASVLADAVTDSGTSLTVPSGASGIAEDFEDSTLSIDLSGTWDRSTASANTGSWALKAATIGDNETTDAVVQVPQDASTLSFWYRVSSEASFDFFRFFIDGVQQFEDSGDSGWVESAGHDVSSATEVTFRYVKDVSLGSGEDTAYVDDLEFTGGTGGVLWTTDSADLPLDVLVGGERMRVTAIENPIANGGAEVDTSGWSGNAGTVSRSTAEARSGSASFRYDSDTGVTGTRSVDYDAGFAVVAGRIYMWTFWALEGATFDEAEARILWNDASGSFLSGEIGERFVLASSWSRGFMTVTAPAGAAEAIVRIAFLPDPGATAAHAFFDDVRLDEQTFTVTRSVNGITKSHDAGTSVELFEPAFRAL